MTMLLFICLSVSTYLTSIYLPVSIYQYLSTSIYLPVSIYQYLSTSIYLPRLQSTLNTRTIESMWSSRTRLRVAEPRANNHNYSFYCRAQVEALVLPQTLALVLPQAKALVAQMPPVNCLYIRDVWKEAATSAIYIVSESAGGTQPWFLIGLTHDPFCRSDSLRLHLPTRQPAVCWANQSITRAHWDGLLRQGARVI